jgi:hypothetical protein
MAKFTGFGLFPIGPFDPQVHVFAHRKEKLAGHVTLAHIGGGSVPALCFVRFGGFD